MPLKEDIKAAVDNCSGDEVKLKALLQALLVSESLTAKEFNSFGGLAKKLAEFCSQYEKASGVWSGKKAEHIAPLKAVLNVYKEQSNLQRAYLVARNARDKLLEEWDGKLSPFYQSLEKVIQQVQQDSAISKVASTETTPILNDLRTYALNYLELLLKKQVPENDSDLTALKQGISQKLQKLNVQQIDPLFQQLQQACTTHLTIFQEKNRALVPVEEKVQNAIAQWADAYKKAPVTWVDWSDIVTETLGGAVGDDSKSQLLVILKTINGNMRNELEAANVRTTEKDTLAEIANQQGLTIADYKRKIDDWENDDARSHVSGASNYSRGSIGGGANLRLGGKEVEPMVDFRSLAAFWHPARILTINALTVQLRAFEQMETPKNGDDDDDDNESVADSRTTSAPLKAPIFTIAMGLINETLSVCQAIKQYMELPEASKTRAYSMLFTDITNGLISLNTDLTDPHPGLDAEVDSDEAAYLRAEKLMTISEALRDNGGWSLLPSNKDLAQKFTSIASTIKTKYSKILEESFQRACKVNMVKAGRNEYRQFTHGLVNQQNGDGSSHTSKKIKITHDTNSNGIQDNESNNNNNNGNSKKLVTVKFHTPTKGATGAFMQLGLGSPTTQSTGNNNNASTGTVAKKKITNTH